MADTKDRKPRDPRAIGIEFPEGRRLRRAGGDEGDEGEGHSRREFLKYAIVGATGVGLGLAGGGLLLRQLSPEGVPLEIEAFPRVAIAKLGDLVTDQPLEFRYPLEHPQHDDFLIKLGRPAHRGVGPEGDIVAFNSTCTHMGCPLKGAYKGDHKIVGPCPCHFSTFDLTRRGIVVLGQATQALPQVVLEVEGDTIYAVGISRIVYGFRNNLKDAPPLGR